MKELFLVFGLLEVYNTKVYWNWGVQKFICARVFSVLLREFFYPTFIENLAHLR